MKSSKFQHSVQLRFLDCRYETLTLELPCCGRPLALLEFIFGNFLGTWNLELGVLQEGHDA